ncbi:MAG: hypothetical protein ACLS9K_08700 [Lachnospira eligens]
MLNEFKLEGSTDFEGNSHEKITEERYVRRNKEKYMRNIRLEVLGE